MLQLNRKRNDRSASSSPQNTSEWSRANGAFEVDERNAKNSSPTQPKKILKIDPHYTIFEDDKINNEDDVYGFYDEWDEDPANATSSATSSISGGDTFDMEKTLSSSDFYSKGLATSSSRVSFVSRSFGDNRNSSSATINKSDITTSSSSSSAFTSSAPLRTRSNSAATILCVLEDRRAPISCRSFENINQSYSCIPVYIAMTGIRIVHDHDSIREIPEYQIKLTIDGEVYVAWKRYEDFRSLGDACTEYMNRQKKRLKILQQQQQSANSKRKWMNNITTAPIVIQEYYHCKHANHAAHPLSPSGKRSHCLTQTVQAWQEVLKHRPWWRIQPYDLITLKQESLRLENFLKHLLFEIPNISMLLEFIR